MSDGFSSRNPGWGVFFGSQVGCFFRLSVWGVSLRAARLFRLPLSYFFFSAWHDYVHNTPVAVAAQVRTLRLGCTSEIGVYSQCFWNSKHNDESCMTQLSKSATQRHKILTVSFCILLQMVRTISAGRQWREEESERYVGQNCPTHTDLIRAIGL